MPRMVENRFDAAVVDKDGQAVAFVEVKAHSVQNWAAILPTLLPGVSEESVFVLAIDPNCILLYRLEAGNIGEPIVRLDTRLILQHYDPELARKQVFDFYLLTLVEAWLRDLAYHWKTENPPGSVELRRTGLLEKIEGGTTERFRA